MLSNCQIIEQTPLQTYCSALLFSPMDSVIRNTFQRLIPKWIVRKPVVESQWSPEILSLEGHTDIVTSVAMSPCDNIIASGSCDRTRMWDTVTGAEVLRFKDSGTVTAVAFSPDGKTVASGLGDGSIQLREFAKGQTTTLKGSSEPIRTVAFSPPDDVLLLASTSDDKTLRVWNIDEKKVIQTVRFEGEYSWPMAFSRNGRSIAIGYGLHISGRVAVWDVKTKSGQLMAIHDDALSAVAFSADGKKAASGSWDGCLKVWDAKTGDVTSCIELKDSSNAIAFSPADDNMVAAGLENGSIVICSTATPTATILKKLLRASLVRICDLAFSMDGELLASGSADHLIRVWDMSLDLEPSKTEPVSSVRFLPKDQNAVAISSRGHTRIQDMHSEPKRGVPSNANRAVFSQDGNLVALIMLDESVQFWDATLTKMIQEFKDIHVYGVAFSNDSSLAVLECRGRIRVVFTRTWEDKASFQADKHGSAVLSPTNQFLAWMSSSYLMGLDFREVILHLQHLETGEELWALPCYIRPSKVAFSPNGELLLVYRTADLGEPGNAVLLEVASGKRRAVLKGWFYSSHVAFNARSSLVAIGGLGRGILIWETATGSKRHILRIGAADDLDWYIRGLQFSPTDQIVAASSGEANEFRRPPDWTIQLWDGETGDEVGALPVDAEVSGLSFSDDSTHLVSWNGRLPLPRADRIPISDEASETARKCLYVGRHWIVQGFENLVWLPPAYRVQEGAAAVRDGNVVLGHQSGLVTSFEFDLGNTPRPGFEG